MSGVAVTTVLDITSSTLVSAAVRPSATFLSTTSLSVIIPITFPFSVTGIEPTFSSFIIRAACSTVLFLSMVLTYLVIMSPIFMSSHSLIIFDSKEYYSLYNAKLYSIKYRHGQECHIWIRQLSGFFSHKPRLTYLGMNWKMKVYPPTPYR